MSDSLPLGPRPTRWLQGLDETARATSATEASAEDGGAQVPSSARSGMNLVRLAEPLEPPAAVPAMADMTGQADSHLRALLRYTEGFYGTAIQYGMRAGPTANAIAHIERAGKALHQIIHSQAAMLVALQDGAAAARAPVRKPPQLHPTTADLVDRFAGALASKLSLAEQKHGYSDGWATEDWMPQCRRSLLAHISKGDPLDVAAYAAFLWHHGATASPWPTERTSQEERIEALFTRIQRLGERFGALWDRHQGKGWTDSASDEFEKIRDVKLPGAKAELRALLAEAQQQTPAA